MNKTINLLTLFILFFLFTSCSKKQIADLPNGDDIILKQQVNTFLDDWHQAAADADFDNYFDKIAENGIYVGTDEEEVWTKKEFAAFSKPFFDKGRAWDFKAIKRNVYQNNDQYIWFNETLDTWMGVCRGSGILYKDSASGQLKIKQYVLSLTVPNERIREVMKVIENTDN